MSARPKRRVGEFEIARVGGATIYRGRIVLKDGSRSRRFDAPAGLNEEQARAWLAGKQAEEDGLPDPSDIYARSKWEAEVWFQQLRTAREVCISLFGEEFATPAACVAIARYMRNEREPTG